MEIPFMLTHELWLISFVPSLFSLNMGEVKVPQKWDAAQLSHA